MFAPNPSQVQQNFETFQAKVTYLRDAFDAILKNPNACSRVLMDIRQELITLYHDAYLPLSHPHVPSNGAHGLPSMPQQPNMAPGLTPTMLGDMSRSGVMPGMQPGIPMTQPRAILDRTKQIEDEVERLTRAPEVSVFKLKYNPQTNLSGYPLAIIELLTFVKEIRNYRESVIRQIISQGLATIKADPSEQPKRLFDLMTMFNVSQFGLRGLETLVIYQGDEIGTLENIVRRVTDLVKEIHKVTKDSIATVGVSPSDMAFIRVNYDAVLQYLQDVQPN